MIRVTEAMRQHRRVSALAYRMLASGKVCAFDWACAHQQPWTRTDLKPEQALQESLVGFVQPKADKHLSPREVADALKQAKVCEQRAPWDMPPKEKEDNS